MIKTTYINPLVKNLYIILIMLVYSLFIVIDLLNIESINYLSTLLKYMSIVIFFITSLFIGEYGHNLVDTRLLQVALFFTLCADTCLLIFNYFKLGVFFFCIVQTVYIIRHSILLRLKISKSIFIFFLAIAIPFILAPFKPIRIDGGLIIMTTIYAILLTTSLIVALKADGLIAYGLIFFYLCDINVALSTILIAYPMFIGGTSLAYPARLLVWIFYLPSQLFLTLSGFKEV